MRIKNYLAACLILAVMPIPAHAYIDPGTGSVLIQGIIAAVAAVGVTLKLYWHRLVGFFRRKPGDTVVADDRANSDEGGTSS